MRRDYGDFSINEISTELKLSRNTVSKVINEKPGVSERTRQLVLGYIRDKNQPSPLSKERVEQAVRGPRTIIFSYRLANIEYINGLFAGMEKAVKECGYLLGINIVGTNSRPPYFTLPYNDSVCGIISFNIYEEEYCNEVLSLGIPSVFLDTCYGQGALFGKADIICPENSVSLGNGIRELYQRGYRNFSFFGDWHYCHGMNQRWNTFRNTLEELNLPLNIENCILEDFSRFDEQQYQLEVQKKLLQMPKLPDAFICASDRQAIFLMRLFRQLSIDIPGRVAVLGFDNLPEASRQLPPLSTIEANTFYQGELAVRKILERLQTPDKPHEYIECETKLILRESTGHNSFQP